MKHPEKAWFATASKSNYLTAGMFTEIFTWLMLGYIMLSRKTPYSGSQI